MISHVLESYWKYSVVVFAVKLLALALFMAWVVADDHDSTVATNNLALVADLLDAWVNLHVSYFS